MIESGSAEITVDGNTVTIYEGDTAFFYVKKALLMVSPNTQETHILWCEVDAKHFTKEEIDSMRGRCQVSECSSGLRQLFHQAIELLHEDGSATHLSDFMGLAILKAYQEQVRCNGRAILPGPVQKSKEYIQDNYADTITTEDLAAVSSISVSQLIKLFNKYLDTTPQKYLWQYRVNKGIYYLKNSGRSIGEIAFLCGFKNQFHFSRLMKEKTSWSPKELRMNHWNNPE